jgi:hypothetical protein
MRGKNAAHLSARALWYTDREKVGAPMAYDFVAWLIKYAAKKGADYVLGLWGNTGLMSKLETVAEQWGTELPEELQLNSPANFFRAPLEVVKPGKRIHLDALRAELEGGKIPNPQLWVNALYEQVQHLRKKLGDEAVSFVRADDSIILPHLQDLAHRLTRVLKTDAETVLPALYDRMVAMERQLSLVQQQIDGMKLQSPSSNHNQTLKRIGGKRRPPPA